MENEREQRKNEIIYDEGFKSVSDRIEKAQQREEIPVDEQKPPQNRERPKPLLITLQLLFCLLIALSLFILKSMDSELYESFESWYDDEMKKTLISQSVFENVLPSELFSPATQDEAAPDTNISLNALTKRDILQSKAGDAGRLAPVKEPNTAMRNITQLMLKRFNEY